MEKIKATRMEFLRLRKQLKTAERGHKLLKEKRDGLMKKFMSLIKELREGRGQLDKKLGDAFKSFAFATSTLMEKETIEILSSSASSLKIEAKKENIMSVWIPKFNYEIKGNLKSFSSFSAPLIMEDSIEKFSDTFSLMIKVAEYEHSARLLSFEIEKTRRRVNALEHIIMPRIKRGIKSIFFKLDEQERSEKIIRMKVKEMISK